MQQISIGGCFTDWEENIYAGDEFRLEIQLPNKNRLPLACKAVYRSENTGIGVKFVDISQFEQTLLSSIISDRLEREGLPTNIDPFEMPQKTTQTAASPQVTDLRREREDMLETVMSSDE